MSRRRILAIGSDDVYQVDAQDSIAMSPEGLAAVPPVLSRLSRAYTPLDDAGEVLFRRLYVTVAVETSMTKLAVVPVVDGQIHNELRRELSRTRASDTEEERFTFELGLLTNEEWGAAGLRAHQIQVLFEVAGTNIGSRWYVEKIACAWLPVHTIGKE